MPFPAPCNTANMNAAGPPTTIRSNAPSGCAKVARRVESNGWNFCKKLYSNTRAPTWAGPIRAPAATATAALAPAASRRRGRCAAIAVLVNQVTPKTNPSNGMTHGDDGSGGVLVDNVEAASLFCGSKLDFTAVGNQAFRGKATVT